MTNLESDMTFPTYGGEVKPATGATLFALGSWLFASVLGMRGKRGYNKWSASRLLRTLRRKG